MHYNKLIRKQTIPVNIEEAWEFFSSPKNLAQITPDEMDFKITSELPDEMYPGQIITYIVKPLLGIPMKWMTEITHVEKPHRFVDNQIVGPYKLWHHQHHFKDLGNNRTEMTDIVHYSIATWQLGGIADKIFVRQKLEEIFDYRFKKVEEIFNSGPTTKQKMPSLEMIG